MKKNKDVSTEIKNLDFNSTPVTSPISQKKLLSRVNALTSINNNAIINQPAITIGNDRGYILNPTTVINELITLSYSDNLADYYNKRVYESDPFATVDQNGVGKLIKTAVGLGRGVKPSLKVGVCGEHGGDPKSIEFFNSVGLDYVSCSPYRVPIARLAAAQATIKQKK